MTVKTLLGGIELPDNFDRVVSLENTLESCTRWFLNNLTVIGYVFGGTFDFDQYYRPLREAKLRQTINDIYDHMDKYDIPIRYNN